MIDTSQFFVHNKNIWLLCTLYISTFVNVPQEYRGNKLRGSTHSFENVSISLKDRLGKYTKMYLGRERCDYLYGPSAMSRVSSM